MIKYLDVTDPVTDQVVNKIPIRVGYIVLKLTREKTGKSLTEAKDDDFDVYEELLWNAYTEGCRLTKEEKVYTREDMPDIMDVCYTDFIGSIPSFFPKTTPATIAKTKGK